MCSNFCRSRQPLEQIISGRHDRYNKGQKSLPFHWLPDSSMLPFAAASHLAKPSARRTTPNLSSGLRYPSRLPTLPPSLSNPLTITATGYTSPLAVHVAAQALFTSPFPPSAAGGFFRSHHLFLTFTSPTLPFQSLLPKNNKLIVFKLTVESGHRYYSRSPERIRTQPFAVGAAVL